MNPTAPSVTTTCDGVPVCVQRSAKRKSVHAIVESGLLVVTVPEYFDDKLVARWVPEMVRRTRAQAEQRRQSDAELLAKALSLCSKYLHGVAQPTSVKWSRRQTSVWGTCNPETGSIRISVELRKVPEWVLDYVIMHELVHLIEPDHNDRFWELTRLYPRTERARGYLEGLVAGMQQLPAPDPASEVAIPEQPTAPTAPSAVGAKQTTSVTPATSPGPVSSSVSHATTG